MKLYEKVERGLMTQEEFEHELCKRINEGRLKQGCDKMAIVQKSTVGKVVYYSIRTPGLVIKINKGV